MACSKGITVGEYCSSNPDTVGCEPEPRPCCKALTAECLSCSEGLTVDEYCEYKPKTMGCKKELTDE